MCYCNIHKVYKNRFFQHKMRKFKGKEFVKQLAEFLKILDRKKFEDYLMFKINFKRPNHSDIDVLTTKPVELNKILQKNRYKKGKDLRYYKKGKIPIDLHDKIKWRFIVFNTKRLMKNKTVRRIENCSFYYPRKIDDLIIKFVHEIYKFMVETKWKIGKNLGLKK